MEKNLENYLTEEEKKSMDAIVSRAMRRREESGEKEDVMPFEFVVVNCKCLESQNEKDNVSHMLEGMCQCIREHGCCARQDELLPF